MTTIAYRDNILAADQCITWYETEKQDEPTSRSFSNKIRTVDIDPYRRLAIATRGDTIDGVLIERLIVKHMREAVKHEVDGEDVFGWPTWDDWGVDPKGIEWEDPDGSNEGVILYRDLRHETKLHAWYIQDARVITRIKPGEFVGAGCDSPLALAAMQAGANPVQAVWIACKYGVASGGPVNYINGATMLLNCQRVNPLEKP